MNYCFGPFTAAGASFRIRHGGGFWCSFAPDHLRLVKAPVPLSEVVTTQPVDVTGTIAVSLTGGYPNRISLVLGGSGAGAWTAQVAVPFGNSRDLEVATYFGATRLGSILVPSTKLAGGGRGIRLQIASTRHRPTAPAATGPATATLQTPAGKAPLALIATSGANIDLSAARLQQ
jgi:hypothetical protein